MPPPAEPSLDQIPTFDSRTFDPPAWAKDAEFKWDDDRITPNQPEAGPSRHTSKKDDQIKEMLEKLGAGMRGVQGEDGEDDESDEEWESASEGVDEDQRDVDEEIADFLEFSTKDLKTLLEKALTMKDKGNKAFTAKPPDAEQALVFYKEAIDLLPTIPRDKAEEPVKNEEVISSGIEEVTEEEASIIEQSPSQPAEVEEDPAVVERREVEDGVRECQKAVLGNIGACHVSLGDDKEAVKACTDALKIDPHYVKALIRRAGANERISTWTSLSSAQDDYQLLQTLLPANSPQLPKIRSSLSSLPNKITIQQEKEKDEMLGKLKELGNGLLGKFGLNTDMFKFEQQPGGGYGMKFER